MSSLFLVLKLPSPWLQTDGTSWQNKAHGREEVPKSVTRWWTGGVIEKQKLLKKNQEEKKKTWAPFFGISASFFGEQEWEKLLEGWGVDGRSIVFIPGLQGGEERHDAAPPVSCKAEVS